MGLLIGVGWLARARRVNDEEFQQMSETYRLLNQVLARASMSVHSEPLDIPEDQIFEAQMIGYDGLHAVRRLAAYHVLENQLPPPATYGTYGDDPVLGRLFALHERALSTTKFSFGWWSSPKKKERPPFEHLLLHSDAEGFYLPRELEHVVFDDASPQRDGIGGTVGASPKLLQECLELARLIRIPEHLDPQSEELWDNADAPKSSGEPWQVYGIEAFGLVCLIHGCRASISNRAALAFG